MVLLSGCETAWVSGCETFAAGLGEVTLATCFNAPFDVIKSCFQSQLMTDEGDMK